jgi:hypothetical protein
MTRQARPDVMDCSRPAASLFWLVVGAALALVAMRSAGQNWPSLLRVGSESPAKQRIERELGPIVSPDRRGHDGQLYYLIARDPFGAGSTVGILRAFDTNPPRYRYRRILFPLLAGGFGRFGGRTTLWGMIFLVALGMGLAVVAIADLSFKVGAPHGAAWLGIANMGALMAAMMLTADMLALGLALAGAALILRRRLAWAIGAFALAGLTKEIYLLVPVSVGAFEWWQRRRAAAVTVACCPVIPVVLWAGWVSTVIPDMPMQIAPFGLPLVGVFHSVSTWLPRHWSNPGELMFAAYVAVSFIAGGVAIAMGRRHVFGWILGPWIIVALCSTERAVWDIPSNVARQFAILWPLSILLLAQDIRVRQVPHARETESES